MDEEVLLAEEKNGIVILTMNRPHAMNSFSMKLLYTMREKIKELHEQSDVRVVIITGAGEIAAVIEVSKYPVSTPFI